MCDKFGAQESDNLTLELYDYDEQHGLTDHDQIYYDELDTMLLEEECKLNAAEEKASSTGKSILDSIIKEVKRFIPDNTSTNNETK